MHRHCTGHKQSMDDNFEKTLEHLKTDYIEGSGDKLDKIYAIIERMHSGTGDRGADFVDLQRDIPGRRQPHRGEDGRHPARPAVGNGDPG